MEGMESGIDKRKMSFGFSLGDDRIKLINILSEDDDGNFLVAPPSCDFLKDSFLDNLAGEGGFRLSGFGTQDIETIQQTEHRLFPSDQVERRRPSFLRRSLAWDNAFYNSAGVLDPDELSFINKGLGTNEVHLLPETQGVKKRRPEIESMADGDGICPNWSEMNPFESRKRSAYISKSTRKKVDETVRNMKADRSGRGAISSPKPPKATGRKVNISTRSNRRNLPGESNIKLEDSYAKTGFGKSTVLEKRVILHRSSTLNSLRLSSPRFSTVVTPTAAMASTLPIPLCDMPIGASSSQSSATAFKRKIEPRNCNLSASLSTPKIWRGSGRSNRMTSTTWLSSASWTSNCSSQSHSSSLSTKQRSNVSGTGFCTKDKIRGRSLHCNVKEESDLQCKLQSPLIFSQENQGTSSPKQYSSGAAAETCSAGPFSVKNFRPSELRPPSPTIGFFDENTPLSSQEATSRKMSQKITSEGTLFRAKAQFCSLDIEVLPDSSFSSRDTSAHKKSGISGMGRKINRPRTPHIHPSMLAEREKCLKSDGKRPRNKLGLNPSLEEEKRRGLMKNKRCKGSQVPINDTIIHHADVNPIKIRNDENGRQSLYCSGNQIGDLSKYLETISLQDKKMQLEKEHEDLPSGSNKNKTETNGAPVSPLSKQEKQLINSPNTLSKPCSLSPLSTMVASVSSMRTPLADKSFISNFNIKPAYLMEPKKENMVQIASIYTSLQGDNLQVFCRAQASSTDATYIF